MRDCVVTKKSDVYVEKYMKIKFDSDDELNKTVKTPIITIVASAVFRENNKYYPH